LGFIGGQTFLRVVYFVGAEGVCWCGEEGCVGMGGRHLRTPSGVWAEGGIREGSPRRTEGKGRKFPESLDIFRGWEHEGSMWFVRGRRGLFW
jgi:hypothetical protein